MRCISSSVAAITSAHALEVVRDLRRHLDIRLIAQLVFQAGPEVHGDRAQLQFDAHGLGRFGQEDRHFEDEVQAAVTVGLGVFNVILFLDQRQVILPHEHIRHRVDILDKRADHADAADVV